MQAAPMARLQQGKQAAVTTGTPNSPAFPARWFTAYVRALVSANSARMCERAVLTNRPSLDLIPFALKGCEPVGERGTDPVVFLNPNSCTGFEPEPSKEGSG